MDTLGAITSLEDFRKIVKKTRERRVYTQVAGKPYRHEFYRGQLSKSWSIKPSLTRMLSSEEQVIRLEENILGLFKKEIEINNYKHKVFLHDDPKGYQNDWAWLSQAQHYGIPTRLLDWTLKPEVALFFALDDKDMDHEDGQFLVLYVPADSLFTGENDDFYETHPGNLNDTRFLNPCFYHHINWDNTVGEVRRARQHGKFSIQTYERSLQGIEEQDELNIKWDADFYKMCVEKYVIPAASKSQLRLDLIAEDWDTEFLYYQDDPIINGIATKCKALLSAELAKNV